MNIPAKQVPLTLGIGGPIIGRAEARFDNDGNIIADVVIDDMVVFRQISGPGHGSFSLKVEDIGANPLSCCHHGQVIKLKD